MYFTQEATFSQEFLELSQIQWPEITFKSSVPIFLKEAFL